MNARAPSPVGVCAVFRNEAPYLREWLRFHSLAGVDRFFLYDNGSEDNWQEAVEPYRAAGLAQVVHWPGSAVQLDAYAHALTAWGPMVRWLAFLDIDEFLFSPTGNTLPHVLKWFTGVALVGACWCCYGTGGHRTPPPGGTIENYLWRTGDEILSRHVKSIVRTARAYNERPRDPHHFHVDGRSVDERGRDLDGPFARSATHEVLRVNHYISRSAQEARRKMAGVRADTGTVREMNLLDAALNAIRDDSAMRFLRTQVAA